MAEYCENHELFKIEPRLDDTFFCALSNLVLNMIHICIHSGHIDRGAHECDAYWCDHWEAIGRQFCSRTSHMGIWSLLELDVGMQNDASILLRWRKWPHNQQNGIWIAVLNQRHECVFYEYREPPWELLRRSSLRHRIEQAQFDHVHGSMTYGLLIDAVYLFWTRSQHNYTWNETHSNELRLNETLIVVCRQTSSCIHRNDMQIVALCDDGCYEVADLLWSFQ